MSYTLLESLEALAVRRRVQSNSTIQFILQGSWTPHNHKSFIVTISYGKQTATPYLWSSQEAQLGVFLNCSYSLWPNQNVDESETNYQKWSGWIAMSETQQHNTIALAHPHISCVKPVWGGGVSAYLDLIYANLATDTSSFSCRSKVT